MMRKFRIFLMPLIFAMPAQLSAQAVVDGASAPAKDIAAALMPQSVDGFYIRMRMETSGGGQPNSVLQVQVKGRRIDGAVDLLYQIQYPRNRQGEGVLIRWKNGRFAGGHTCRPGGVPERLDVKDLFQPVFGTALNYHDTNLGFWGWGKTSDKGSEEMMGVDCRVIDLEPAGRPPGYRRVRCWIDKARLVPMQIQKYTANGLSLVIRTDDIARADDGRFVAREYTLIRPGGAPTTKITGTRYELQEYPASQFTPEAMREIMPK